MRTFLTKLTQIPMFVRVGVVIVMLLLGTYAFVVFRPGSFFMQPVTVSEPETTGNEAVAEPTPTSLDPEVEDELKQHYMSVAQEALSAAPAEEDAVIAAAPADEWQARIIQNRQSGQPTVLITMPLHRSETSSNAEFVQATKASIAHVISTLFTEDPALERVGVVATLPNADGKELPAVSIFVKQQPEIDWATLTIEELETIAQSVYVRADFLLPETAEKPTDSKPVSGE